MSSHWHAFPLDEDGRETSDYLAHDDRTGFAADERDPIYIGPLIAGMKVLMDESGWLYVIERNDSPGYIAFTGDDPDFIPVGESHADKECSYYGAGPTRPEAIRYLLAEAFGPVDEGYSEQRLHRLILRYTDPMPDPARTTDVERWLDQC